MSYKSHYDVLDISENASDSDLRDAFKEKIREHPPEQDPEGYKLLREAYDILSNPVARREYDNLSEFGDRIEQLQEEANEILQSEEPAYDEAIRLLKQAVVLGPEIGILRDKLGGCYLSNENPDRALTQFDKAVQLDPSNRSYRLHKGFALRNLDRFDAAESVLRPLWKEDMEDYEPARALASTLIQKEEYDAALSVLHDTIFADGQEDFEDFFCYYDKLHIYIILDDEELLQATLQKVQQLTKRPDDKRFASFMLAEMGQQLHDVNRFSLAHRFIEAAQRLVPYSNEFDDFAAHLKELRDLEESAGDILDDDEVHDFVKLMVSVTLAGYLLQIEKVELKSRMGEIADALENMLRVDPFNTEVKKGVRLIKQKHRGLYNINPPLYERVLRARAAVLMQRPCPHCDELLNLPNLPEKQEKQEELFELVELRRPNSGNLWECGHCGGAISYTSTSIKAIGVSTALDPDEFFHRTSYTSRPKRTPSTSSNSTKSTWWGSWGWLVLLVFFVIMCGALGG